MLIILTVLLMFLQCLMRTDHIEPNNGEHHEHIDDKYLQILIQLRKMGLLKKEDIQRYVILSMCCLRYCQQYGSAGKRFRFMVEWDPNALTQTDEYGDLLLGDAGCTICYHSRM